MDGYTYETVYKVETGGYDWTVIAVFKRSDGAFAVAHASGCSCDSFEEDQEQTGAEYFQGRGRLWADFRKALIANQYSFSVAQGFEHEDAMRQAVWEDYQKTRKTR